MRYYGHRFEQRDPDREKEYDEKHLAECREVKTYKLTPEEIAERYGDCKGQGEKASPLANIRNLGQKPEVDEMGKIYETSEVLEAVKATMEKLNVTEHCLGARDIAKYLKKYEPTIYKHMDGVTGLANILGLPTLGEYKKRLREDAEVSKAKKASRMDECANAEPTVLTITSENIKEVFGVGAAIEELSTKGKLFNEYKNKVDEVMNLELEIIGLENRREDKQNELLKLENWLEGFEAAAKLAGVSLE